MTSLRDPRHTDTPLIMMQVFGDIRDLPESLNILIAYAALKIYEESNFDRTCALAATARVVQEIGREHASGGIVEIDVGRSSALHTMREDEAENAATKSRINMARVLDIVRTARAANNSSDAAKLSASVRELSHEIGADRIITDDYTWEDGFVKRILGLKKRTSTLLKFRSDYDIIWHFYTLNVTGYYHNTRDAIILADIDASAPRARQFKQPVLGIESAPIAIDREFASHREVADNITVLMPSSSGNAAQSLQPGWGFWVSARSGLIRYPLAIVAGSLLGEILSIPVAACLDIVFGHNATGGRWPLTPPNVILVCIKGLMTGYIAGGISGKHGKLNAALANFVVLLTFVAVSISLNRDLSDVIAERYDTRPALWTWIALVPALAGGHFGMKLGSRGFTIAAKFLGVLTLSCFYLGCLALHVYTTIMAYQLAGIFAAMMTFGAPPVSECIWLVSSWNQTGLLLNRYSAYVLLLAMLALVGVILLGLTALIEKRVKSRAA